MRITMPLSSSLNSASLVFSWDWRSLVRCYRDQSKALGSCLSALWGSDLSGSRSMSRSRLSWGLLLRATLLACAIGYSTLWLWSETILARSLPHRHGADLVVDIDGLREAATLFPLDSHIRNQLAISLLQLAPVIPPAAILHEIDGVLKNDPWAPDMIWDRKTISQLALKQQENAR